MILDRWVDSVKATGGRKPKVDPLVAEHLDRESERFDSEPRDVPVDHL